MSKPKIFVGSSIEGLTLANAVQYNLDYDAEVTIWNQGQFKLSMPVISSLIQSLNIFDFAIFIFSPDDILRLRGEEHSTIRDNVIFETGLFIGKLGIERAFIVKPRGAQNLHLPSDFAGLVIGEYDTTRSDRNWNAATSVFCTQVRELVKSRGCFNRTKSQTGSEEENLQNDLEMIFSYLSDNSWTMISFEKIQDNIHSKLTEEHVMKIIEAYPKAIRRCKVREGVNGIKWLKN